jgi:hypothetical protein
MVGSKFATGPNGSSLVNKLSPKTIKSKYKAFTEAHEEYT